MFPPPKFKDWVVDHPAIFPRLHASQQTECWINPDEEELFEVATSRTHDAGKGVIDGMNPRNPGGWFLVEPNEGWECVYEATSSNCAPSILRLAMRFYEGKLEVTTTN